MNGMNGERPQIVYESSLVGRVLMQANTLFAIVVGIALFVSIVAGSRVAIAAIVAAVIVYMVGNNLGLSIITGSLSAVWIAWLEQRTAQKLHRMQYEVYLRQMNLHEVPALDLEPMTTANLQGGFQPPALAAPVPGKGRFVPVAENSVARDAIFWAMTRLKPAASHRGFNPSG